MKRVLLLSLAGIIALLAWALYLEFPAEPELPGQYVAGELAWEGRPRSFLLYVPEAVAEVPPLVFVFHGSGGDAAQSRLLYGYSFEALAERHGFIVAYPEGYERHYNGCRLAGPYAANEQDIDDVGFMRALVDELAETRGVDRDRVYATGVSNGGQMALRLALEAPDLVAAVAPVATSLPTDDNLGCAKQGEPVAFLLMNGTADPMNPYEGGTVALYGLLGNRGTVLSSNETVAYWASLAGHSGPPEQEPLPDTFPADDSTATVFRWRSDGAPTVALVEVRGGGHNAPHPDIRLPRALGGSNRDFDAAELIWRFFEEASD